MLNDAPLTKRQLGWLMIAAGIVAAMGIIAVDVFGAGAFSGFGPAQWQALGGCGVAVLLGLSLTRLGDHLA
jgi:hypothetical protein